MIRSLIRWYDGLVEKIKQLDFLVLFAIRMYLVPIIFTGARSKVLGFSGTVQWFGSSAAEGGLGLPFPTLLAFLATSAEVVGCFCLALGLFTRPIALLMIFVMGVAGVLVHWKHGWPVIAGKDMESTLRLNDFIEWLSVNFPGRYNYITELGDPVILNNGMEFVGTYTLFFLVLLVYGGGRYLSVDYWLKKWVR